MRDSGYYYYLLISEAMYRAMALTEVITNLYGPVVSVPESEELEPVVNRTPKFTVFVAAGLHQGPEPIPLMVKGERMVLISFGSRFPTGAEVDSLESEREWAVVQLEKIEAVKDEIENIFQFEQARWPERKIRWSTRWLHQPEARLYMKAYGPEVEA